MALGIFYAVHFVKRGARPFCHLLQPIRRIWHSIPRAALTVQIPRGMRLVRTMMPCNNGTAPRHCPMGFGVLPKKGLVPSSIQASDTLRAKVPRLRILGYLCLQNLLARASGQRVCHQPANWATLVCAFRDTHRLQAKSLCICQKERGIL